MRSTVWLPLGVQSLLHTQARHVVQSHPGSPLSVFDRYKRQEERGQLQRNKGGNFYRLRYQKLFASSEALESSMTEHIYTPIERVALPPQQQHRQVMSTTTTSGMMAELPERCGEEDHEASKLERLPMQSSRGSSLPPRVEDLIVEADDLGGTPLDALAFAEPGSSATFGAVVDAKKHLVEEEHRENVLSHTAWHGLSPAVLDPVVARIASATLGPTATRLQVRLLQALLHEDHKDVVLDGVDGSGKTSALLLALMQGMRNESTGLNVLITSSAMNVKRAVDTLAKLSTAADIDDGGCVLDDGQPLRSWLLMAPFREETETYAQILTTQPSTTNRRVRLLVTTADVFCELMFQHKLEFEAHGYLRRVYVDDCSSQLSMLPDHASTELIQARLRDPVALELMLGSLHQLPGPHIRSIMQIACVSAALDTATVDHLKQLCLKPDASNREVILSPVHRLPSNIHCSFCFRTLLGNNNNNRTIQRGVVEEEGSYSIYVFVAQVLWSAAATLCGRVVIFVRREHSILEVRKAFRKAGLDAKLLSEVVVPLHHSTTSLNPFEASPGWKFVLLREHEGEGVHLPLVSHVVITFAPASRASLLHMSGRTGRLGNRGWVLTVADQADARQCRTVAEELQVDFINSVVRLRRDGEVGAPASGSSGSIESVPADDVDRITRDATLYGLDPQYAVAQHYDQLTENPDLNTHKREFFGRRPSQEFYVEDYTPVPELHRRHKRTVEIAEHVEQDPAVALQMQEDGMLDSSFKPTSRLRRFIKSSSLPQSRISAGQRKANILHHRENIKRRMMRSMKSRPPS